MKIKINKQSMIKNGTITVIIMLATYILFGIKNIMIAFPISLTSIVLGRQNFYIKTFNKAMYILFIDIAIVIASYLASINMYTGIVINFIAIFLIIYCMVSFYNPGFYKPFIMLYIFTQYVPVRLNELPLRILTVIFGVLILIIVSYINRTNEKMSIDNSIKVAFGFIEKALYSIKKGEFNEEVEEACSRVMRDLIYRVYVTRYKKYLTTNLGALQFDIYITTEYLNFFMKEVDKGFKSGVINKRDIVSIEEVVKNIICYANGALSVNNLEKSINMFIDENRNSNMYMNNILPIFKRFIKDIKILDVLEYKERNKLYREWERTEIDMFKSSFKSYFNRNSIRFKFAMRMAITLSFSLFVSEKLGKYKMIWAIITIMSIMQPYYEDTISKTKERVFGNIIAILFTGVSIHLIDSKYFSISLVIASVYLLYGFKEYYLISFFAAISSIGLSSITDNINKLLIYRVMYVFIGAFVVLAANKFIFPYKLENGIEQLMNRVKEFNEIIIKNFNYIVENNEMDDEIVKENINEIRDVAIHSILMSHKLYIRNIEYKEESIDKFIKDNNRFVVKLAYKITST